MLNLNDEQFRELLDTWLLGEALKLALAEHEFFVELLHGEDARANVINCLRDVVLARLDDKPLDDDEFPAVYAIAERALTYFGETSKRTRLKHRVKELIRQDKRAEAVKLYRTSTNASVADTFTFIATCAWEVEHE